jgi:predicted GNAT family acetyltransferase
MDFAASDAPVVTDNPAASRYEMRVGDKLAGFVDYRLHSSDKVISFMHTQVEEAFAGAHLGTQLARATLDDARARGLAVLPYCPFTAGWIRKHPDYADLVPEGQRSSFDI